MINTVLGSIKKDALGITLAHEHICCYSECAYLMARDGYLDKKELLKTAAAYLKELKETHGLRTFVDCTPINIGRDTDLLRKVSEQSEVNIVAATGFYYSDEPVLYNTSPELLCKYMITDADRVSAGIIKCAVEQPILSGFQKKLLKACAMAHLHTGLPIVLHTNARNKNALGALEILFSEGVKPTAITVGHLSDTDDMEYVKSIAAMGCYIGLDRLYGRTKEEYISQKAQSVSDLCLAGYGDQILLSHDALFFNGFEAEPCINEKPRFSYCFDFILPQLPVSLSDRLMIQNPARMLACE